MADSFVQLSPLIAAVVTLGIAFVNWRNTVASNKGSLKETLEKSINANAELARDISGKLDKMLDAFIKIRK